MVESTSHTGGDTGSIPVLFCWKLDFREGFFNF